MVGKCEWNSVGFFVCEVCSVVSRSISWARCLPVVTAESGLPRFLKNWHISSHLLLKLVSSLQGRLSLRN